MKEHKTIFWLLGRVRRRIPMMLTMVVSNAGSALFGVLFALGTREVIDSAVAGESGAFTRACAVQLAIICAMLVCFALTRYLRDRLVTELDRDWKRELLSGLLLGEYAQVSAYHSGELVNRLNNDVRVLNDAAVSLLPGVVSMTVRLVAAVVVLAVMEPVFTAALVLMGIGAVIATGFARRGLKNLNKRVSQAEGKVLSFLQEALERLLVVQAMDLTDEVERRADVLLDRRLEVQRRRRRVSLAANTGVSVLYYLAEFAALVWCAFRLLYGGMTFGTLTVITQLVSQLQAPFVNLSGIIPQYAAMIAAAERLMELEGIESYPQQKPEEDPRERYGRMDRIGAEGMSFAYEEEKVFHQVAFSLPKGAFVAVTGASGIGKSTLLKLMLGIFQPVSGMLYLQEGEERVPLSRNTRGLFAYVPQGNFLFSGSLRDNLLIGNPKASAREIDEAVHVSAMDKFLEQLPAGLDSEIGENGAGLSEGQVQRLAIARAVLSGAPILLLDEATSALDVETERAVLERIARLPGRTCITVSHRPAAVELADWNLEVKDGNIQVKRAEN